MRFRHERVPRANGWNIRSPKAARSTADPRAGDRRQPSACQTSIDAPATAADGSYAFRTIRPAAYGVAGSMRPAHIHVVLGGLVTQIYFAGDPHLGSDPLRSVREDLVVNVVKGEARFDINV